jgi:hypothetical protein
MNSLILSNSELTTIVCALLEPQENPEIRHASQLLAGKLQLYLSSPLTSGALVRLDLFLKLQLW